MEENLPEGYRYFHIKENCIRVNLFNEEDVLKWINDYSVVSCTSWNVKFKNTTSSRYVCRTTFICHHSSFKRVDPKLNRRGKSKNCNCKAIIEVMVKLTTKDTKKKDKHVKDGLPAVISFKSTHNHTRNSGEALSLLKPTGETKNIFESYFNDGLTAKEAIDLHESKLELDEGENGVSLANAALNPKYRTVIQWYNQWRIRNLGPRFGEGILELLKNKQESYRRAGVMIKFKENPFAILIMTPIMQRAHELPFAKDIAFVDTTSSCDAESHSVTFVLTPCQVGAVPLAVIITKGQSVSDYTAGFQLIKESLSSSFCGQGFPKIFITDDSDAERQGLQNVWPESTTLLCRFHVSQAVWRWLWEKNHTILKDDRPILFKLFHGILVAPTVIEAAKAFLLATVDSTSLKYPQWIVYVKNYWARKELWCLAWRDSATHGHQTNNFSEVTVRLFKDIVLSRNKAYNPIALVDFVCTGMEQYYSRRLRNFANGRCAAQRLFLQSQLLKGSYIVKSDILVISKNVYNVPKEKCREEFYQVDTEAGFCSCDYGRLGKFCKHRAAVFQYFDKTIPNAPPATSKEARYEVAKLAFGDDVPPISFYEPLQNEEKNNEKKQNESEYLSTDEQGTTSVGAPCASEIEQQKGHLSTDEQTNISVSAPCASEIEQQKESENEMETSEHDQVPRNITFEDILQEMQQAHEKFNTSDSVLNKLHKRIKRIQSPAMWESFLSTAGSTISLHDYSRAKIRVQPTSLSRRRPGITRGSKRLPVGRPPVIGNMPRKVKRRRNLALNVRNNQPNAKSHGAGH